MQVRLTILCLIVIAVVGAGWSAWIAHERAVDVAVASALRDEARSDALAARTQEIRDREAAFIAGRERAFLLAQSRDRASPG